MTAPAPLLDNPPMRLKACRHGPMLYLTSDRFIGRSLDLYGEFSQGEADLFGQIIRPGMTVVDVGANMGVHTVYMAQRAGPAGRVLAFEPQRIIHQILSANIALNALANVEAHRAGLGAAPGEILVPAIDYAQEGNFGGLALGKFEGGEPTPVRTLDSFELPACHFIKIDVEGMEPQVLMGAEATVARCRPLLYVENDRRENSAAVITWFQARDYRLYWHLPPLFNPDNFFGDANNQIGAFISVNMLAIPAERKVGIERMREVTGPQDWWRAE